MSVVRIGNGAGFWGDNLDAPVVLAERGDLDYLTLEYLAELTLSILAYQRSKDPATGYATDFLDVLARLPPALTAQSKLRVVTNAGGMNPLACVRAAAAILTQAGLGTCRVAAVSGDDLLPCLPRLVDEGHAFENLETGAPLSTVLSRVVSANAYLGAAAIVEALEADARIVVTGRVADASLIVGPAVHEFGWSWDHWDRLAGATVAGHLIECGAQVTGGLWTNWQEVRDLAVVGYPIAELRSDGSSVITKPAGTGGVVNRETVVEQLVYEIGDPAHYLTPDVDADFTTVDVTDAGRDRVQVQGATGRTAPDSYKVSIAYHDGYMASGMLVVCGRNVVAKARECGRIVLDRVRHAGYELEQTNVECLGTADSVPGVLPTCDDGRFAEVVVRLTARDRRKDAVERFARELAPLVTSGPPGIAGYTGGRPKVRPVLAYWPTLVPKECVGAAVEVRTAQEYAAPSPSPRLRHPSPGGRGVGGEGGDA
jgi:hypothetical protein